jgi:acetyl-CoA synthetase
MVDIAEQNDWFKSIVDEALNCPCVENVLVAKESTTIKMKEGRDQWLQPL